MECDNNYEDCPSDESDTSTETIYDGPYILDTIQDLQPEGQVNVGDKSAPSRSKFNQVMQYQRLGEIMRQEKPENQLAKILKECQAFFKFPLTHNQQQVLKKKLEKFKTSYQSKWQKSHRMLPTFLKNEATWLSSFVEVPESWFMKPAITMTKTNSKLKIFQQKVPGQRKPFEQLKKRSQQMKVKMVAEQIRDLPTPVILKAARRVAINRGKQATSLILKDVVKHSDQSPEMLEKLRKQEDPPKPYTSDEALALLLEMGLSRSSYKLLRQQSLEHGAKLFPSYDDLAQSKKKCYPKNIEITETVAKVPLQDLLNHTVKRIVQLQTEPIKAVIQAGSKKLDCTLICTYGFDGSSGHSRYHQKFGEGSSTNSEESLFATTLIPMRLVCSTGQVLWQNPVPQSIRYCRPLKLEFVKESAEKILMEKNEIEKAISELRNSREFVDGVEVSVNFELRLTLVDGKCLQVINGATKSSQSCPMCAATPKTFNSMENLKNSKFVPKPGTLIHGTSPLHSWIRFLEFCLNLAYRKPGGAYPVTQPHHKKSFAETKQKIQNLLRESLGILVDVVKQGAGTTNNGNMARKAFQNHKEFSRILDIDSEFVSRLHTILLTMSCQLPVDSEKFGNFCRETFSHYVSLYSWHPMSATLHKILVHGEDIIKNSILPLGMMSEEAAESRNKFYRQDREFHARKMNRIANLTDLFNRALETSDPFISNLLLQNRKKSQKHQPLPPEVKNLLVEPDVPFTTKPVPTRLFENGPLEEDSDSFYSTLNGLDLEPEHEI